MNNYPKQLCFNGFKQHPKRSVDARPGAWGVVNMQGSGARNFPDVSTQHFPWFLLPSGNLTMENGHRNSEFSHEKWWIFP